MDQRIATRDRGLRLRNAITGALTVAAFAVTGAVAGVLDRPAPQIAPSPPPAAPQPRRTTYVVAPPAPAARPPVTRSSGS